MSDSFPEAIKRADFTIAVPQANTPRGMSKTFHFKQVETNISLAPSHESTIEDVSIVSEHQEKIFSKENAVLTTDSATLPSFLDLGKAQVINFGTGIEFKLSGEDLSTESERSSVVLPCIFGSQLEGPVLLATGTIPSNVPFLDGNALRGYYEQRRSIVVIVDERMTDNARNLATSYRINAIFIVQLNPQSEPKNTDEVLSLLNSANINAVTALAGPQSLVLIQISGKYYFYRGLAKREHLDTTKLAFGSDVTAILESVDVEILLDSRAKKVINLDEHNTIILPFSGQFVKPQDLLKLFETLSVDQIRDLEGDINAAVPQLQMLLNQKDLGELSKSLVSALSTKISDVVGPSRKAYLKFLAHDYDMSDPESVKKKNNMLGDLRKTTKEIQKAFEPAISSLANMMSAQTTSKRTHDLKRLVRQAQIQGNVEAVKSMTFDTLAGYLETYAEDMGVMLVNIETLPYRQLLGNLKTAAIDARYVKAHSCLPPPFCSPS